MAPLKLNIRSLIAVVIAFVGTIAIIILEPLSRDYSNYIDMFNAAANTSDVFTNLQTLELTFSVLAFVTQNFMVTVFIMSVIGLSVKMIFFCRYTEVAVIAVLYYFARFFLVQDVTQIRIAFAIAMLLLAFNYLLNKRFIVGFLFLFFAVISHTSTIAYIPIIWLSATCNEPGGALKKIFRIMVIIVPILLLSAALIFEFIPLADIIAALPDARLGNYYNEIYDFEVPNLFTDVFFYLKLLALLTLVFWRDNTRSADEHKLYLRFGIVFLFSLMFFVLFHQLYAIATRLADIAAPFECIIVALFIVRLSKPNFSFFSPNTTIVLRVVLTLVIVVRLVVAQQYLFS